MTTVRCSTSLFIQSKYLKISLPVLLYYRSLRGMKILALTRKCGITLSVVIRLRGSSLMSSVEFCM